jgi:hypothetical protein
MDDQASREETVPKKTRRWPLVVLAVAVVAGVGGLIKMKSLREQGWDRNILSNAHGLSSASEMYMQENGVTIVRYDQLVGPDKLLKQIRVFDGETYPTVFRASDHGVVTVTLPSGRTITWTPSMP